MSMTTQSRGGYLERPQSSSLADVIEVILDKGLVIDAYVRVSLVGIEVLTIDARIVIASVDTYLRFAEATNRLDLTKQGGKDLPGLIEGMSESGARGKTSGAISGVKNALTGNKDDDDRNGDDDDDKSAERRPARRRTASRSE
ncbi:gas vesicle protein GvpJ [Leifsonia shinshuensis]